MLPLLLACCSWFQSRPADLREVFAFTVQGGAVHSVAFSPDGAWLAGGGQQGDVILWHAASRAEAGKMQASEHWVGGLCFSPDSKRLAVMGQDLSVWDVATRVLVKRLPAMGPRAVAFSPDGRKLAFSVACGRLSVVDAESFAVVHDLQWQDGTAVNALAFSSDSGTLLAGDNGPMVVAFDLRTGKHAIERNAGRDDDVGGLAFLPDGTRVVLFSKGEWQAGERRGKLARAATGLAVSRDGRQIAMAGEGGRIFLCDGAGQPLSELDGGSAWIPSLSFAPDGQTLASAGNDGRVLLWHAGKVVAALGGFADLPHGLAFSGDERFAVATGRETVTVDLSSRALHRYPGGGLLVSGSAGPEVVVVEDQRVRVANVQGMTEIYAIPLPEKGERNIAALSPDGRVLVLGGGMMGKNLLVDLRAREARVLNKDHFQFVDLVFSADGKRFAAASVSGNHGEMGKVQLWSAAGELLYSLRTGSVDSVALDAAGTSLYWVESPGSGLQRNPTAGAHRMDTATFADGDRLKLEASWLRFLDKDLAISHDWSTVTLRRAQGLEEIRTLRDQQISAAVLSPSRRWLLLAGRSSVKLLRIERQ
jgi:WD40 repeat protein